MAEQAPVDRSAAFVFGRRMCREYDRSSRTEWLETNGIGGFACGTIAGVATRRYHGLLVTETKPPVGRFVTLAAVHETLAALSGDTYEFSCVEYEGVVQPRGYEWLESFGASPFPGWTYRLPDGSRIRKRLAMLRGENSVVVQYRLMDGPGGDLRLRPRMAWREYHALRRGDAAIDTGVRVEDARIIVEPTTEASPLVIAHTGHDVHVKAWWFYGNRLAAEQERGLDFLEDHWSPCEIVATLSPESPEVCLIATHDPDRAGTSAESVRDLLSSERERRSAQRVRIQVTGLDDPPAASVIAEWAGRADDYIVARGDDRRSIIAGYPWFTDWGRDTMISLPGLTLAVGRRDIARSILTTYAEYCSDGMIPNRFPDGNEAPDYNTADATLWYVEAIRRYAEAAPEDPVVEEVLYPTAADIVEWHLKGTRYGIRVDRDGLLLTGEDGTQLTWMDAKVDDWVVTPRVGKPVEINALWYNALRTVEVLAWGLGHRSDAVRYASAAAKAQSAFRDRFVGAPDGGLYDVVDGPDGDDATVRPNQIFAVSLARRMLDNARERRVVTVVERLLRTPYGLRTLDPSHADYTPAYEGGPVDRDAAYHRGTVWCWLWGPFMTAYGNAYGRDTSFRSRLVSDLVQIASQASELGLGGIPEIRDGDAPHRPRGCPWQAWSMAEVLRVAAEEGIITVR